MWAFTEFVDSLSNILINYEQTQWNHFNKLSPGYQAIKNKWQSQTRINKICVYVVIDSTVVGCVCLGLASDRYA
jgi:hypothetical protein